MTTTLKLGDVKNNFTNKQKDDFSSKINFVQGETKRLLCETNPGLTDVNISIGKEVYEEILNTKDIVKGIAGDGINENLDLIYELCSISTDLANKVNSITAGIKSGEIELREFVEQPEEFCSCRYIIQNGAYEKLLEEGVEILNRRQVYLYDYDVPLYDKLLSLFKQYEKSSFTSFESYLSSNIDKIISEFVEYYKENEQFFIENFLHSEDLGEVITYNVEEGVRLETILREHEKEKLLLD